MRDRSPAADDGVVLAAMFHTVKEISEVTGRFGCRDVSHTIRLSDSSPDVNPGHADRQIPSESARVAGNHR